MIGSASRSRIPLVIAHRGDSDAFPENTLAAFEAACRPGVAAVELDVQLTRDGIPVVFHDPTLERMGHGPGRVGSLDYAEVSRLDVGRWKGEAFAGEKIPRLEAALGAVPDREVWIEAKVFPGEWESGRSRRTLEAMVRAVEDAGARERVRFLCFDRSTLDWAAEQAGWLPRVWNLEEPVSADAIRGAVLPQGVDIRIRFLTPDFAAVVRSVGVPLYTYTCDTEAEVGRSLEAGVAGIVTNRPGWLVRRLGAADSGP